MKHRVPKEIQLLLIEQFNCDKKNELIKISADGPINDKEYTLFKYHVAEVTATKPLDINTWKRVFERLINDKTGKPFEQSDTTCQIIAKFLGCESWSELEATKETLKPKHKKNVSEILPKTTDSLMHKGDVMEIQYGPDRKLRLEFQGNAHFNFKVVNTVNTMFEYGDLVHVPFIREGEPLIGWDIMRNNRIIGQYNSADNHLINKKRIIPLKKDS
ncbi:hypothetical protein QVO32_06050 [Bacteroides gallinaceum]|uniref:hypothetical protein n=1 Tax=Bacteroides gallinaceum TaxID=1462571 RepID=UPI0025AA35B2|nr:hypothetical protein [Bacteroides gallinaceum]MDN0078974.1 hypothetical protein [Bacteroides gallinaceum]